MKYQSLLEAIEAKDELEIKEWNNRAEQGEIMRIY